MYKQNWSLEVLRERIAELKKQEQARELAAAEIRDLPLFEGATADLFDWSSNEYSR